MKDPNSSKVNQFDLKINKICGSGDINTSLWYGAHHEWPITDTYLISKNTPYSKNYEAIDLADNNKIIFTRNAKNLPIVRFALTEGKVWFNSDGYQTSKGRKMYPLFTYGQCNKNIRTRSLDPRYKLVGSIYEDRLFKDNEIYDVVTSLPDFPTNDTKEYMWNLYINNYYYWSHFCENSETTTRQSFAGILENIIDVKNQNNYILETSIFYVLGICMVLQYFFWYFTLKVFWAKDSINKPMRTLFHIFAYPIKIVALLFLMYFSYQWIKNITAYQDTVISITVSEWAPDFTSQAFFAYEESLQSVYHITSRVIVLASISLFVLFFDLICELTIRGCVQSTYGKLYDEWIN